MYEPYVNLTLQSLETEYVSMFYIPQLYRTDYSAL